MRPDTSLASIGQPAEEPFETDALVKRFDAILQVAMASGELDLTKVGDVDLLEADTPRYARLAWVASYLRYLNFVRRVPASFNEEAAQASAALGFLRHIERSDSAFRSLLLGREKGDKRLVEDVQRIRVRMTKLIEYQRSERANGDAEDS